MKKPDFQDTIEVLSQESAREILRILDDESKSVKEVFEEMKNSSSSLKYRESVFKSLERMVETGLVEKIKEENRVRYRSLFSKINADLIEEKLDLKKNKKGDSK